ncbi:MAG: DUF2726 domain-containing protein [Phycisphaerales bacterium]|nr:DUF2726 domain-containing protein [Phycisphaerales bacterium]
MVDEMDASAADDFSTRPGCLGFLARLLNAGGESGNRAAVGASEEPLPYRRKDWLLSKGERAFYEALCMAVDARAHRIFCKVRLADLVWLPKGVSKRQSHQNRIQSKHVDFVICSAEGLRPLLVIELDDRSHEREDRRQRDAFVDRALAAAGLPVWHAPAAAGYRVEELAERVRRGCAERVEPSAALGPGS